MTRRERAFWLVLFALPTVLAGVVIGWRGAR